MNTIKGILSVIFLFSGILSSHAQLQKTFGFENQDDYGQTILKATDSSFYLIGSYSYVSQIDTSGKPLWEKEIRPKDGMFFNILNDALVIGSMDLVVLSSNYNKEGNKDNINLAKFNFYGDSIWTKSYGNPLRYCNAERVIRTKDKGFAIIGSSAEVDDRYMDLLFIKTDSLGKVISSRSYSSEGNEHGIALSETDDGNFILVGNAQNTAGATDIYIIKINSSGDTIWTRTIGGERNETSSDIIRTSSGKYLIMGTTSSFGIYYHDDDLFLMEIDDNGNINWKKTYGGMADESGTRLLQTRDDNILLIGNTTSFGFGQEDILLMKTNTVGDTLFTLAYGGSSIEIGENIVETEKGFYLLGETRSFSAGNLDMCLIQTDSSGKADCRYMYVHPSISDPVWVEHSGSTVSNGCLQEMTELQLLDVSIKTNDICVCITPVAKFETDILDGLIFFNDLSTWPDSWFWDFGDGETSSEQNAQHFMPEAKSVCLIVQNQCGSDTTCETVFGGGGGLNNDYQYLIKLFPNPADDYITVTCEESLQIKSVSITDVLGNEFIGLSAIDKFPMTINTSTLSNGIYMVRFLTYDHISISKKIIIE